jgi:outer membrane protein assembly factor BamB
MATLNHGVGWGWWLFGVVLLANEFVATGELAAQPGVAAPAAEGEWPQFLGPRRHGVSGETGLLDRWPESGPRVLWRVPGGVGMSGLAISRGRALTLVQRDGRQWLVALRADTGEEIWRTDLAPAYRNAMGDGPRATPSIDGDRVAVFTGEGILAAVDFRDGKLLWSHATVSELGGKEAEYGMASSPLVIGDRVVVTIGAPRATLAAYDIQSGRLGWTAGSDPAGYSSPAVLNVGGREQLVAFTGNSALGVVPSTGAVLWRYPYVTNYECNIATPIAHDGRVFLSSGENHGSVLLELIPRGDAFDLRPVWESQGPASVMRNEWQTSLLWDGHLYGMDNVGGAGPITHLTCIDASTGQRKWQQIRFGKGNLIAADGKLWISTMKGEVVIVRATPERYEELGRANVLGSTRQAPALAGGRLFLRDDQEIVCMDIRRR